MHGLRGIYAILITKYCFSISEKSMYSLGISQITISLA